MIGDVPLAPWTIVMVDTWMWTPYVMLICLAGLRSIPDYIYEAAEVDRASRLAAVLVDHAADDAAVPHARGAVPRHRELQDVRHGEPADLGRAGLDHRSCVSITLKREAFEKWRTGYSSAFAIILFVTVFGAGQHLRQGAQPGETAMSRPGTAHSVVDRQSLARQGLRGASVVIVLRADHDRCRWSGSS